MWIARDKNGELWLHKEKPAKFQNIWCSVGDEEKLSLVDKSFFSEVQWSDKEPKKLILKSIEDSHKFFQNKSCKYFPCHSNISEKDFNCMFCYCPLYNKKECGGNYRILENGIKDCSGCVIPHGRNSWDIIQEKLK
jgi:Zn-finger protein